MKPRAPDRNRTCNLVLTRDLHYLLCYESISQDGTLYVESNHLISLEEKLFTLNIYVCIAEPSLLVLQERFELSTRGSSGLRSTIGATAALISGWQFQSTALTMDFTTLIMELALQVFQCCQFLLSW